MCMYCFLLSFLPPILPCFLFFIPPFLPFYWYCSVLQAGVDVKGFCSIAAAVSVGADAVAEFADISFEDYMALGDGLDKERSPTAKSNSESSSTPKNTPPRLYIIVDISFIYTCICIYTYYIYTETERGREEGKTRTVHLSLYT